MACLFNPYFSQAQFSGGSGTQGNPWQISTLADLQAMDNVTYLGDYFILINDIDASATSSWNSGAGFDPIGDYTNRFTGDFNGAGYKISNLYINRSTDYTGLFGFTDNANLSNIGLVNVSITGDYQTGGLIGYNYASDVIYCYVTGSVSATDNNTGGLIGFLDSGNLSLSFSEANVSTTGGNPGGLVGYSEGSYINNTYAMGSVSGSDAAGLVSYIDDYEVNYSYATGYVGGGFTAGFVYEVATGDTDYDYWNTDSASYSYEGTGLTTAQMKNSANYSGFDFTNIWAIDPNINQGYPYLRDNAPVEAHAQNAVVFLDASGNATLSANTLNDNSSAASGIANLSLSQTAFSCSNADSIPPIVTALDLDGVNDFINVPNNAAYESNEGTLEMWVKPNAYAGNRCLISMRLDPNVRYSYYLNQQSGEMAFWNGNTYWSAPYSGGFTAGKWYHLALVYNSSRTDVFINGDYALTLGTGVTTGTTGRALTIGSSNVNGSEVFSGQMSDIRIWNTRRNAVQIKKYKNRILSGSESGLVGYFPVLKGKGEILYDYSSTDNDGTLTNMDASTVWINNGTEVVLTVTDNNGNVGTDTAYVSVADTTTPTVIPLHSTRFVYPGNSLTINSSDVDNGSSDNCNLSLSINRTTISLADTIYPISRFLKFDGNNDYIVIPNHSDFEFTTGTIELWAKPTTNNSSGIIGMRYGSSTRYSFHLDDASNLIGFWNGGAYNTISYPFEGGEWYHIAFSIQPNKVDVYINGQSIGTFYSGINSGAAGLDLSIGGSVPFAGFEPFSGEIDEVRYWNDIRTQAEIQSYMYVPLAGNEANLVAYYPFNEAADTVITDEGPNGHDGAMANMNPVTDRIKLALPVLLTGSDASGNSDAALAFINLVEVPFAGGSGTVEDPWQITTLEQLQAMDDPLFMEGHFILMNDIDAAATFGWNGGKGFNPIGNGEFFSDSTIAFKGSFRGMGYIIYNLYINRPTMEMVGLFSDLTGDVDSLGFVNDTITGWRYAGPLTGICRQCKIERCYATGSTVSVVGATGYAGALLGSISYPSDTISDCYSSGTVTTPLYGGGLSGSATAATIVDCYSSANVNGGNTVGGLIGAISNNVTITQCYATGNVSGVDLVGGLLGGGGNFNVNLSYASGSVTGTNRVGGLIGQFTGNGYTITNNHFSGTVNGGSRTGGLIGTYITGTVSNNYTTSATSGSSDVGGIVGFTQFAFFQPAATNYWNTDSFATGTAGTGLTTAEMKQETKFSGFDFTNTWAIHPLRNDGNPYLRIYESHFPVRGSAWTAGAWDNGTPSDTVNVWIRDNTAPASFTAKDIYIEDGMALNTGSGNTITVSQNVYNFGNGFSGTGTVSFDSNGDTLGIYLEAYEFEGVINVENGTALQTSDSLTLTASSTSSYGQIIGDGAVLGNVKSQAWLDVSTARYHYLGSPFTNATLQEFNEGQTMVAANSSQGTIWQWNAANAAWEAPSALTDVAANGEGYAIYAGTNAYGTFLMNSSGVSELDGTVANGDIAVALAYNNGQSATVGFVGGTSQGATEGWNLLANPYPSQYNWDGQAFPSGTNDALYISKGGTYASYVSGVGTNGGTQYLAPFQAFWVQTTNASPGNFTFEQDQRVTAPSTNLMKTSPVDGVWLKVSGPAVTDELFIGFDQQATLGFDAHLDAHKLLNKEAPNLSTKLNGDFYAICRVAPHGLSSFPLALDDVADGQPCSFKLDAGQLNAYTAVSLEDKMLNVVHDLKASDYHFTQNNAYGPDRFVLHFSASNIITEEFPVAQNWYAYTSEEGIVVQLGDLKDALVQVYDLGGRLLFKLEHQEGVVRIPGNPTSQFYVIKVNSSLASGTQKIIR
tara:strand:+ start:6270 stop:11798 length:5529 start_codon:yes stop_codon:yes gene_type:complete